MKNKVTSILSTYVRTYVVSYWLDIIGWSVFCLAHLFPRASGATLSRASTCMFVQQLYARDQPFQPITRLNHFIKPASHANGCGYNNSQSCSWGIARILWPKRRSQRNCYRWLVMAKNDDTSFWLTFRTSYGENYLWLWQFVLDELVFDCLIFVTLHVYIY